MQIQKLDFPTPVFVIDDFLPKEDAQKILAECWALEPHYQEAQVHHEGKIQKHSNRKNDVVYLDEHFASNRGFSDIIVTLERKVFKDKEMADFWHEGHSILKAVQLCSLNQMVLSRYGNCDFYGWHTDNGVDVPCNRIVTLVYYVNTEPEKFTGGSLMLRDGKEEASVKPKHNRAVIFPSYLVHQVENVRVQSKDPKDHRYSINMWMGFRG